MGQDWLEKCGNSDDSRCGTLTIVRVFFGTTSFVCSLFMIFIIWLFKKYMFFSQRLIMYLSIAALVDTIPYMMGSIEHNLGCKLQGYLMTYFDWTCVGWICVITANMYRLIKEEKNFESQEYLFHLVCWMLPLIIAGIPFFWDAYGHSGPWCWIKGHTTMEKALRFIVWYGPAIAIVLTLTALLIYLRISVKKQNSTWAGYNPEDERAKAKKWKEVRVLFMYPLVFIVISIFPLITRVHMALSEQSSFTLVLLTSVTAPFLGAVNSLLYSCSPEMRAQIRPSFILSELRHRKSRAEAESYNFTEEPTNPRDIQPYSQ